MVKMAPNEKNKTTFISQTLKVGEIKVELFFFDLSLFSISFDHPLIFGHFCNKTQW